MDNQKVNRDRRKYNRKLLKRAFQREGKEKKKINVKKFAIECFEFFVAYYLASWLVGLLPIHAWYLELLTLAIVFTIIRSLYLLFIKTIWKKEN
jgi:hypothetical protein